MTRVYDSQGVGSVPDDDDQEKAHVSIRTKSLGAVAAIAAIAVAIPTAVTAYAEPTPEPAEPTPATTAVPVPTSTEVPDPQGPGCDAYRKEVPTGPGSIESMASQTASQAIANNPDLSTFSAAISGKLNPDINIVSVLDNGPYVVFAPTDAAFAKLDPATLETLKTDPVVLLPILFYHMVLGYLGPKDVAGTMPTQDGRLVTVTGEGGDIKVNDNRVVCAYTSRGAYIYMIDEVLMPPTPAAEAAATPTTSPEATTSSAPTSAANDDDATEDSEAADETADETAPSTSATTAATTTSAPAAAA